MISESNGVSCSSSLKKGSGKYPYWIEEIELCLWCRKHSMEISSIEETEDGNLLVNYECSNPDCDRLKRLGLKSDYKVVHGGKSVENYNRFMERKKAAEKAESEEKKNTRLAET